jgi:hypothetical protein
MQKNALMLLLPVAAASGLVYWLISAALLGTEPFPVTILYRYGDTDYLSLIYAFSRFQFHEFATEGLGPPRLLSFPPGLAMFYALPIAILGDYGFPVADVVVAILRMAVCFLVAKAIFKSANAAAMAAIVIFVVTGPLPLVSRYWELFNRPLWDMRLLRPYVGGLLALSLVLTTHRVRAMLSGGRYQWRLCAVHGVSIGLAAQGELHLGIIASFSTAAVLAYSAATVPNGWRRAIASGAWIGGACLIVLIPMVIEVLASHPDVLGRFGQRTVSRLSPPLLFDLVQWFDVAALGLIAAVIAWRRVGDDAMTEGRQLLMMSCFYVLMAALSTPLSGMVLGRGVQMFHFPFRSWGFTILGYTIAGLIAVPHFLKRITKNGGRPTAALTAGALIALSIHFAHMARTSLDFSRRDVQQRSYPGEGLEPIVGYRTDLGGLWKELQREQYRERRVLGTLNQQLAMLWLTRPGHYTWNPDPFVSMVTNDDIEKRLIAFCQLVQMTPESFARHLREMYFRVYLLSSQRWSEFGMPDTEHHRLVDRYATPMPVDPSLDIVILEREGSFRDLPGPERGFHKTYENRTFSLWLRDS